MAELAKVPLTPRARWGTHFIQTFRVSGVSGAASNHIETQFRTVVAVLGATPVSGAGFVATNVNQNGANAPSAINAGACGVASPTATVVDLTVIGD